MNPKTLLGLAAGGLLLWFLMGKKKLAKATTFSMEKLGFDIKGKKIHFLSVTPELVENPHYYYYKDNPEVFDSPKGTKEQRTEIKELFNNKLKKIGLSF